MQNTVTFTVFKKECNLINYCKSNIYIFGYTGYTTFANFQKFLSVYTKKYIYTIVHIYIYEFM